MGVFCLLIKMSEAQSAKIYPQNTDQYIGPGKAAYVYRKTVKKIDAWAKKMKPSELQFIDLLRKKFGSKGFLFEATKDSVPS